MGFRFQSFQVLWIIQRSLRLRSYEKHECYVLLKINLDRLLKVHRKCVCFLMKYIAVYRKMISSENWNFLRGPFYTSQPIAKLNFKLSIMVGKQTDKNTGKYRTVTGRGRKLNVVSVILPASSRHNISNRFVWKRNSKVRSFQFDEL